MKQLSPIPSQPNYIARYIEIRDSKKDPVRPRLIAAHAEISAQYASFENAVSGSAIHQFRHSRSLSALKGDLRACYDGSTKRLVALKKEIKDVQPLRRMKLCPMCNTTLPRTYDHYLAADLFPELSVHGLNLVPCCSTCNSAKGDTWLNNAGERQYLHFYSDSMPSVRFLECELHTRIGFSTPGATFKLNPPVGTIPNWSLIENHFRRLSLIERYKELSNDEISEIIQNCRIYLSSGGTDAKSFLAANVSAKSADYGVNYWWSALADAMLSHANFENWIK